MEIKSVNILKPQDWKIVKIIKLEKPFGSHNMWAELIYLRDVTNDYGLKVVNKTSPNGIVYNIVKEYSIDNFDNMVLDAVKTEYSNASFRNHELVTDFDVETFRRIYGGQLKDNAIVYLNPESLDFENKAMDTTYLQFRIPIELYIPCKDFQIYFCNEGYMGYYDNAKADELQVLLDKVKPTLHGLSEILK